ncbi:MAG: NTP transferase domain-containing protein, partial [Herminiimonas sp.]|nr:NTP transferase domain-containing protein [Herminiimonas sp.]
MQNLPSGSCVGLLLAAGRGRRFDATGERDKLRQVLPGGRTVAAAAAANLLTVLPHVIAVVRPDAPLLACELAAL